MDQKLCNHQPKQRFLSCKSTLSGILPQRWEFINLLLWTLFILSLRFDGLDTGFQEQHGMPYIICSFKLEILCGWLVVIFWAIPSSLSSVDAVSSASDTEDIWTCLWQTRFNSYPPHPIEFPLYRCQSSNFPIKTSNKARQNLNVCPRSVSIQS